MELLQNVGFDQVVLLGPLGSCGLVSALGPTVTFLVCHTISFVFYNNKFGFTITISC